jgi:hypothetical protein
LHVEIPSPPATSVYLFQDFTDVNSRPSTKCLSRNDEFCSKSRHAKKLTTGMIDKPGDATYYILVIDDEEAILKVVRTALSRVGEFGPASFYACRRQLISES